MLKRSCPNDDGILNHHKGQSSAFWFWHHGYQFCAGKGLIRHGTKETNYGKICISRGDVVVIRLDLINFTLSFTINSQDYGIAFEDIDRCSYRLALTMPAGSIHSRFQLL